jgi:hypothetical protein
MRGLDVACDCQSQLLWSEARADAANGLDPRVGGALALRAAADPDPDIAALLELVQQAERAGYSPGGRQVA